MHSLFATTDSHQKWAVMVTVTESYDNFFQNWLTYFSKLDLDMDLIVYAEDDFIYDKYSNTTSFKIERSLFQKVKEILAS